MEHIIIGLGTVGKRTYHMLENYGKEVKGFDKREIDGYDTINSLSSTDIFWICTPEDKVREVLEEIENLEGLVIVRSTTEPRTVSNLIDKFKRHIIHIPDFEVESEIEIIPDYLVVGSNCDEHFKMINKELPMQLYKTNPTTSETVKITANSFLANLISFWNEVFELSEGLEVNSNEVAFLVSLDDRIPNYGTDTGWAYGGSCLPKDVNHFINIFSKVKREKPNIMRSVKEVNDFIKEIRGEHEK